MSDRLESMKTHTHAAYALMAERMGKALSPQLFALHCRKFVDMHISPNFVIQAVEEIVLRWDDGYNWPTADYIATRAKQIASEDRPREPQTQVWLEHENAARLADQDRWDRRSAKARVWAEANPGLAEDVRKQVDAEIEVRIKARPDGFLATNEEYRKEFRRGMFIGEILNRAAPEIRAAAKKLAEKVERKEYVKPEQPKPARVGEVIAA